MSHFKITKHFILITTLVSALGCGGGAKGPDVGTVTGVVTMDGTALPNVNVGYELQSAAGGRPSIARTDESGKYTLRYDETTPGALVGTHKVTVSTPQDAPDPSGKFKDPIPAKYNTKSELVKEVKAGSNVIDLELTSK
ncbi:carboxypeptidase-like regulatory domain-containing protein [Planctomicrobium sp. SH527]|uniref:carboxypeptidase-like regulatory domain-containing protein n=1 Tax=Planctomicrobium sp. SH527 TaxID=3448123 RepID=UPI003F5AFBA0